jgi:hypothetical protein
MIFFKINIITIVTKDENNNKNNESFFFYFLKCYDVWYERLRHVNNNYIQRLTNLELLSSMI